MILDRRMLIPGASALATVGASGASKSEPPDPGIRNTSDRVLGIGGLFFRSHDPKALAEWYQHHLGIDPVPADYAHPVSQQAAGPTVFAPFPMDTQYFGSPQQAWMVNFRVRSLDAMVAQLRASGVGVEMDPEVYPNGRFARLHDPEENAVELWEPAVRDPSP